jgi:DNA-directed RNA polymerase subunit RPC12/RpoP
LLGAEFIYRDGCCLHCENFLYDKYQNSVLEIDRQNDTHKQCDNTSPVAHLHYVIGISFAVYLIQMTTFKLSERLLPGAQEKLTIQKQRLSASYHCSRCSSVQLKIIFKAGDAKVYPYFQCQDCRMEDRIS